MRLYSFVNFYLSSIQQGVQTAHLVHELYTETTNVAQRETLEDWARNHKTIIILNGGANQDIKDKLLFMLRESQRFSWDAPVGSFREDDYSLDGIITCCGIVVPEKIYGALNYRDALEKGWIVEEAVRDSFFFMSDSGFVMYKSGTSDHMFIEILKSCGLAR